MEVVQQHQLKDRLNKIKLKEGVERLLFFLSLGYNKYYKKHAN